MLGSPCSPCCNVCGTDWTYASVVEVELEGTDYYSTWHGRSLGFEENDGVARDYYFSFGFKGSAYNGTFQLTRNFISNSLAFFRNSQWEYLMPGVPQLCSSGATRPPGIHAFLYFPAIQGGVVPDVIFDLWPSGSCASTVSIGRESFTPLDDMRCLPAPRTWYFGAGAPSHAISCSQPLERVPLGWTASENNIVSRATQTDGHMTLAFSVLGGYATQFGFIAVGSGQIGRDPSDWYGGLYTVLQQVQQPPYINVEKVSSTRPSDPDRLPSAAHVFDLSEVVKLKRVRVLL